MSAQFESHRGHSASRAHLVFYSATLLDEPFETLTHFNPIYYMIGLVRYGFLGYSDINVGLSLGLLSLVTLPLFALNHRLLSIGWKLRA